MPSPHRTHSFTLHGNGSPFSSKLVQNPRNRIRRSRQAVYCRRPPSRRPVGTKLVFRSTEEFPPGNPMETNEFLAIHSLRRSLANSPNSPYTASCRNCQTGDSDGAGRIQHFLAGVAQLVEHNVANVVVVSSNLITRSFLPAEQQPKMTSVVFLYLTVGTSKEPVFY